ncbi:MAG: S41 family peptidase [Stellaceae bacterium]
MQRLAIGALMIVLAAPCGAAAQQQQSSKDSVYEELNLFDEAFERVRQDSVDPVTDTKLVGAAIAGMLSGLDPHAAYLDAAALKAQKGSGGSEEPGVGVVVTIVNGEPKVISPRDGSPAAEAGIKPGDLIFSIDKQPTYELSLAEIEQKLRGPAGSSVALVLRRGNGGPIRLTLKRAPLPAQTVAARVIDGNLGYLRVAGFDSATQPALAAAVQQLRDRTGGKLAGLVLDLRNDPGGDFSAAVAVADAFLDKGDVAVIKGRKPFSVKHISATPGDLAKGLPIVVLVNGGTAHEAELVVGALQDNHRAILLGTKTFGESAIESLIPLGSGGAVRLTTSRFTTPNGREIDGKGLEPDLTVTPLKLQKLAQEEVLHEADLPGALKNPDQPVPGTAVPGTAANPGAKPAPAGAPPGATATPPPKTAPSVATGEIGGAGDEQLTQALDVLRGLAVFNRRASG